MDKPWTETLTAGRLPTSCPHLTHSVQSCRLSTNPRLRRIRKPLSASIHKHPHLNLSIHVRSEQIRAETPAPSSFLSFPSEEIHVKSEFRLRQKRMDLERQYLHVLLASLPVSPLHFIKKYQESRGFTAFFRLYKMVGTIKRIRIGIERCGSEC